MTFSTFRLANLCVALFSISILLGSARADSIVHFEYAGSVTGGYDIQVYSDPTPITANNFLRYVNNGMYNNTILHRYDIVNDYDTTAMEGGGFKLGDPNNQEVYPISAPLSEMVPYPLSDNELGLSNLRGTIAMVKLNGNTNNATSKWSVNLTDNSSTRDGQNSSYIVFGKILGQGITFLDSISLTNPNVSTYRLSGPEYYNNPALSDVPLYQTYINNDFRLSFIAISSAAVVTAAWNGGVASVDWGESANWGGVYKDTCVPDGAGSKISLDNQTMNVKSLDMASAGRTVGSIVFNGPGTSITSSGQFSLTLDNIDKPADISVTGTHSITAPVILASDTTIQGTGELTLSGGISGGYALKVLSGTLNATSIQVDSLTIGDPSAIILPASWKGGAGTDPKDWGLIENWNSANSVPGGAGCKVVFGEQTPNNPEVDLKTADQTVGIISFNSQTSTTIMSSGQHILTLDNLDKTAEITVSGTHTISVPVVLGGDAVISGPGTLDMTGGITGAHKLTVASGILNAVSIQVDTLNIGNASAAAVPEPSTAALLSLAFAGIFAFGWRSKKRANY